MPILETSAVKASSIVVRVEEIKNQLAKALATFISESNTKQVIDVLDNYYANTLRNIPYTVEYRTLDADVIEVDLTITPPQDWVTINFTIASDGVINQDVTDTYIFSPQ